MRSIELDHTRTRVRVEELCACVASVARSQVLSGGEIYTTCVFDLGDRYGEA